MSYSARDYNIKITSSSELARTAETKCKSQVSRRSASKKDNVAEAKAKVQVSIVSTKRNLDIS